MCNLNLENYYLKTTSPEPTAGRTLLYIAHYLSNKIRNNLLVYGYNHLELTFIEIINLKKSVLLLDVFVNTLMWLFLNLKVIVLEACFMSSL